MKEKSSQIFCFQICKITDLKKKNVEESEKGDHHRVTRESQKRQSPKSPLVRQQTECRNQLPSSLAKVSRVGFLHRAGFLVALFKSCFPHKPPSKT